MADERFRDLRALGDRPPRPSASALQIMERFHVMLRDRQEEMAEANEEEPPAPPSADDVVRCYEDVLSELTFNSKPIITELTMIAGQKIQLSKEIADVICARVLVVPAEQKLPSLYLIDSIVKNIGRDYVKIFATQLPKVFCVAYKHVDPSQYPSMRHLFGTWSQVFPSSVLQKIEDELQFSPSDSRRTSTIISNKPSKSLSPRPSHGIHVNPKYLEARRQQSAIHAVGTSNSTQVSDLQVERMEGLVSENSDGCSEATHKFHGIQQTRLPTGIQVYGQKPIPRSSEYDFDHPELPLQHLDKEGETIAHLKKKTTISQSPPRIGLKRPISPPDLRSHNGTSKMISRRASTSHSGGYAPGVSDASRWLDESRLPNEDPRLYKLNNGYVKQNARDLIDAYGNPRGRISVLEKFSKVQRFDVNDISREAATRNWKNTDEEEYVWEDMSPTLSDRRSSLPMFEPTPGSFRIRTEFPRPNLPKSLASDIARRTWPGHAQLPQADDPSCNVEDRIAHPRSQPGLMKSWDGTVSQKDTLPHYQDSNHIRDGGKLNYIFPPLTQQNLSPRSCSKAAGMLPLAARGMAPVSGQRHLIPNDTLPDIKLPILRSSDDHSDPFKIDNSVIDRHSVQRPYSPASIVLPSGHISQSLSLLPILQNQSSTRNSIDVPEPNRPTLIQGSHSFVPQQQYDLADTKDSDPVRLLTLRYQPPAVPHLSQQNKEKGIRTPLQSQGTYLNVLPPGRANVSSYSVGQPLKLLPELGHGIRKASAFPSSKAYSTADASLDARGDLPPLPSGPPPASSQMRPTSQNISSLISSSPANAFSGLINSLMAQGLISLNSNSQSQDSLGVEFNQELLKVRHESAINSLYDDLPRQCTTCGLRFKCQEDHSSHMDWHVTKNRISRNRKQKPSRKWFVSAKEWLSGAEILGNDVVPGFLPTESVAEQKEDKEMAVPADENQNVCALCGEPFEDFYSDETEEWMYKGAVYLNAPDGYTEGLDRSQLGSIVHAKCRSESNESVQS